MPHLREITINQSSGELINYLLNNPVISANIDTLSLNGYFSPDNVTNLFKLPFHKLRHLHIQNLNTYSPKTYLLHKEKTTLKEYDIKHILRKLKSFSFEYFSFKDPAKFIEDLTDPDSEL